MLPVLHLAGCQHAVGASNVRSLATCSRCRCRRERVLLLCGHNASSSAPLQTPHGSAHAVHALRVDAVVVGPSPNSGCGQRHRRPGARLLLPASTVCRHLLGVRRCVRIPRNFPLTFLLMRSGVLRIERKKRNESLKRRAPYVPLHASVMHLGMSPRFLKS